MTGVRKPCPVPGCPALVTRGRCPAHARQASRNQNAGRVTGPTQRYGREWPAIRRRVLAECPACQMCGWPATLVHHVVEWPAGSHDRANLAALCAACHNRVHQRGATRRG